MDGFHSFLILLLTKSEVCVCVRERERVCESVCMTVCVV